MLDEKGIHCVVLTTWRPYSHSLAVEQHSVAEARNHLSALIDRTLAGEAVIIPRHGYPVVELKLVHRSRPPVTEADLEWVTSRRVGKRRAGQDAGSLVSSMRDDKER